MKIRQQKIETKPINFVTQENSNTESCEEESRKPSPPTFKKPQKSSADAIWRKRIAEATLETEEDAKESSDRPVVPLNASERPTDGMAVAYPAGREEDIIRFATKIDCGESDEYLICSTLISQCILHCNLNLGQDDISSLLNQIYLKFNQLENEVKANIVRVKYMKCLSLTEYQNCYVSFRKTVNCVKGWARSVPEPPTIIRNGVFNESFKLYKTSINELQ